MQAGLPGAPGRVQRVLPDLHLPAAGAEPAAGAAAPGAAETATAPPAGTLASLPIPTETREGSETGAAAQPA